MDRKKAVVYGVGFLALTGLTFYVLFHGQDPESFRAAFRLVKLPWLGGAAGCMAVFFCCEARNLQTGLTMFDRPVPYRSCLRYALTGFFFSSVTPSSSGGQPMQILAMHRDGHRTAGAALALLTDFFAFQVAAAGLACAGFLLQHEVLLTLDRRVWACFLVGAGVSLLLTAGLCGAVFSRRLLPALWRPLMALAGRIFPKRAGRWDEWGKTQWTEVRQCARYYRANKGRLTGMLAVSLLELSALHSIPYWVCRGLGVEGASLPAVVGLQAVLFLSASSFPLPGAVGLSEGGFLLLYRAIYPAALLESGMLLSRMASFYLPLLVSGILLALIRGKTAAAGHGPVILHKEGLHPVQTFHERKARLLAQQKAGGGQRVPAGRVVGQNGHSG